MTLEGLMDPEGGTGDLLRLDDGAVYLISICCLVVKLIQHGLVGFNLLLHLLHLPLVHFKSLYPALGHTRAYSCTSSMETAWGPRSPLMSLHTTVCSLHMDWTICSSLHSFSLSISAWDFSNDSCPTILLRSRISALYLGSHSAVFVCLSLFISAIRCAFSCSSCFVLERYWAIGP
ncbi:hypothetical protein INR49_007825 [Caranx melampygus]|nr:hypothetical protein INR49_007825 [Caranx melampygus]